MKELAEFADTLLRLSFERNPRPFRVDVSPRMHRDIRIDQIEQGGPVPPIAPHPGVFTHYYGMEFYLDPDLKGYAFRFHWPAVAA